MSMKRIVSLIVVSMIIATMLIFAFSAIAMAQYEPTPPPDTGVTPGADTSVGATGTSPSTSGTTGTSTGTTKTGGELLVFALAGAGLLGSGYFVLRRAKA